MLLPLILQRMMNTKQLKNLSNACADDIVKVLQDKYKSTQSKSEKVIILTIYLLLNGVIKK